MSHNRYSASFGRSMFLLTTALACCSPSLILAAQGRPGAGKPEPIRLWRSPDSGRVSFLAVTPGATLSVQPADGRNRPTAADFLRRFGHYFDISDASKELIRARTATDALGHTRSVYHQIYQGVPVFSGILQVHQDKSGSFIAANGDFYRIKGALDVVPSLTKDEAIRLARKAIEEVGADSQTEVEKADLVIVDPGWYGNTPIGAHLAYHIVLSAPSVPLREAFFVDAHQGEVLDRWSMICTLRERLVHDYFTGSDCCVTHDLSGCDNEECAATVCEVDSTCCRFQWHRGCVPLAVNLCDNVCIPGGLVRSEGDAPTGSDDADAIYDYLGDAYDYFHRAFGRDGIDGLGSPIVATASWPFFCPNAFWDGGLLLSGYCEGTAADDVIAHEFMHGITQFTADLIGRNQPGQLSEAYSDIFGELVDLFNGDAAFLEPRPGPRWPTHGTGPGLDGGNYRRTKCSQRFFRFTDGVRWLIAEDAPAFRNPIRDMWDPTCLGHPDRANSPLQTCDVIDRGGVHSGNGVPNHAFVLMVDGGEFNGYAIPAIGPIKAAAVWYRALTTYLTLASDFQDAFLGLNQAARDLIGSHPNDPVTGKPIAEMFTDGDARVVDQALRAVEMDTRGRCGRTTPVLNSDPPSLCGQRRVIFEDDFENGVGQWTVMNTSPPTPYDWVQVTDLPFDRPGTAWFIDNGASLGCEVDETAIHSLISPEVVLPDDGGLPFIAFTHYMQSEPAYDGGVLRVRVNGGDWVTVPPRSFEFNPYNSVLRDLDFYRNTNALGGQSAWTGLGGRWGTSVASLSDLASAGDTLQIRFDFGKDFCVGSAGWYVDDVVIYTCADCNRNGISDHQEFTFTYSSGPIFGIGAGPKQEIEITDLPQADGDITMSLAVVGDFSSDHESLTIELNDTPLATVFETGPADCPFTPDEETVIIPVDLFNQARRPFRSTLSLVTTDQVNRHLCGGSSFLTLLMHYPRGRADQNANQIPDECENCAQPAPPAAPSDAVNNNRYLSFVPGSPGRQTAVRVTAVAVPRGFEPMLGQSMWVGPTRIVTERSDRVDMTPPNVTVTRLDCGPLYRDRNDADVLHVFGAMIVPGARYAIQAVDLACDPNDEALFSEPLLVETGRWGDIVGVCDRPLCDAPDGRVDIVSDVSAVVDKFNNLPGAVSKVRADVTGTVDGIPDGRVGMEDIALVLDAFLNKPFPFARPTPCPPSER